MLALTSVVRIPARPGGERDCSRPFQVRTRSGSARNSFPRPVGGKGGRRRRLLLRLRCRKSTGEEQDDNRRETGSISCSRPVFSILLANVALCGGGLAFQGGNEV